MTAALREVESVDRLDRAGTLLNPLRLAILAQAREPRSPTAIAAELGLARQKVNYHVRELARHGFLTPAGRRRRRNLWEQRWRATARSYVVAPEVLGPVEVDWREVRDERSADFLIALAARTQREVAVAARGAAEQGVRLPTLSLTADVRFVDADQRRRFTEALRDAVARVVAEHAAPMEAPDGSAGAGRPCRLVVGCHPIPPEAVEGGDRNEAGGDTSRGEGGPDGSET